TAWDDLARTEAAPAFRAQGRLRAAPAEAVALLAARVQPAAVVDAQRLVALVADLGSPQFARRERATAALKQLGQPAEPMLREAAAKSLSAEVRRRADALLAELESSAVPAAELRGLRAVEVLEWIATPAARQRLARLARGDAGARLTHAAAAALN